MPDLPSDWESLLDEKFDYNNPAWKDIIWAPDAGLCARPPGAQEPTSSDPLGSESDWRIDNSFNPALYVGSSDPGLTSSLGANFGFNSSPDHGSQNPWSSFADQPHTFGNITLANNINPLPVPQSLADFNLPAPPRPSYSPSVTVDYISSNVPSLGSIPTQPTSPSLMSQWETHDSSRLPLPPRGGSSFRCSVCGSTFALRGHLRYVSPSRALTFAHANFAISDATKKTTNLQHVTLKAAIRHSRSAKTFSVIRKPFMPINCQHRFHCRHVTNVVTRLDDQIISSGTREPTRRTRKEGKGRESEIECWQSWYYVWNKIYVCDGFFLL